MIIGLTGGIGSRKSAAGYEFSKLGITVIDADLVAKEAASKNSTAYKNIVDHFGNDILDDFENIDRKKLRDIIFSKPSQKEILESFLHPVIKENITNQILSSKSDYTIIMVPLIFETNSMNQYQRILVVDCDEELQISRASKRDNSNKEDIQKILNSQASREERLSIADEVILNNSSIEFLKQEVLKVHKIYMDLVNE
jgi:dephospho-CoA kinase